MRSLLLVMALGCYASFAWGIFSFFRRPGRVEWQMRAISLVGSANMVATMALLVLRESAVGSWAYVALALFICATALFWWSIHTNRKKPLSLAYSSDVPEHFVTEGPYRFVRHPFYVSYLLAWIAGPIATSQLGLILPALILYGLYRDAACREESKFLSSPFRSQYLDYQSRAGRFLPKIAA